MTDEAMADAAALTRARQSLMAPRGPIDAEVPRPDDPTLDAPVETNRGAGIRLAEIGEEGWRWLTARVGEEDRQRPIPRPQEECGDVLLDRANLLYPDAVCLILPRRDGSACVAAVSIAPEAPRPPEREVVLRAVLSRGGRPVVAPPGVTVTRGADGRAIQVRTGDEPTPEQVMADSAYLSAEHQLYFSGRFRPELLRVDLAGARAALDGMEMQVTTLASIHSGRLTWAWAERRIPARAEAGARALRRFGADAGMVDLLLPTTPLGPAEAALIAKPVCGWWTHAVVPVAADTWILVLLEHPRLRLPAPSPDATRAAVSCWSPDPERSWRAYARARGVRGAHPGAPRG